MGSMAKLYKAPKSSLSTQMCVSIGIVCAVLLFLLVPLTQLFKNVERSPVAVERIEMAPPAPPPPIEDLTPPPKPKEEPPPPEFVRPIAKPSLEQLELSLSPGLGGDLSLDTSLNLNLSTETTDELSRIFDFAELDEIPRLVRQGQPKLQQSIGYQRLLRKPVEKRVVLNVLVSESGSVTVKSVESATHEELVPAATQVAEGSRFTVPLRDGKPVSAIYPWPIEIQ